MQNKLKPMPLVLSLSFFGIPTILSLFSFYIVMPFLNKSDILPFYSYFFSMGGGIILLLCASFVFYKFENNPWNLKTFCERFRINKMTKHDFILFIIIFIPTFVCFSLAAPLDKLLPVPALVPDWLKPSASENTMLILDKAIGGIKGNWPAFFMYFILLIINIFAEEFWWRGYILPRQEIVFGKATWIVHGLLWTFFHLFKYWEIPGLFIMTMPISFVAYRTKNTTTSILIHFLINASGLIPLFIAVI